MMISAKDQLGKASQAVRRAAIGIALMSLPINLLMLTGPLFMLQVYDRVLASGSVPTLIVLGGLTVGLFIFYGLLEAVRSRALLRIGQRLDADLSGMSYQSSIELPLLIGKKAQSLSPVRDLDSVRQFLCGPGPAAICDLPWMPLYLCLLFLFHPILGFVALSGTILLSCLIGVSEAVTRIPAQRFSQQSLNRSQMAEQAQRNCEVIAAMGMMDSIKTIWEGFNTTFLNDQRQALDRSSLLSTIIKTTRLILQSTILGVGAWLAIYQEISPGMMIAGSILMARALSPIEQAVGQWRGFVGARQAFRRLKEVFHARNDEAELLELPRPSRSLKVEQLISGPVGIPILKNVSFELSAGQGLGIIGPSGSGKSTLGKALVGIHSPMKGAIRLDDSELSQWEGSRRGQFVGYLPQDIQLFAGTVAQNISRFDLNSTDEDVLSAACNADAHKMIAGLEDGYETQLGMDGNTLSGGQIQRLALARAMYGDPFLVVLDEPNSNLDSAGEDALRRAIETMRKAGAIVIVIAHRQSALAAVDHVLCMQEGQVQAFGPKEQVLRQVLQKPAEAAE